MAKIGLDGSTITNTTASNHIYYRWWNPYGGGYDYYGNPIGAYNYGYTSATVRGTVKSTVTNVKINGKSPIVVGDRSTENDSYSIPNGEYVSGSHSNAQGSVTVGNTKNVKANGKLIAISGSNVTTHASTTATINGGLSTTVNIG